MPAEGSGSPALSLVHNFNALMAYMKDVRHPGSWAYDWPLRSTCTDGVHLSKQLLQAHLVLAARPPWPE